jgi:hypothetical protein
VPGLANTSGEEGSSLLYQFRVGRFSLVWNDSAGPVREQAPQLMDVMRRMPATDVQVNAVLGFNSPTNGVRDPVDYLVGLRPKVMFPNHHDFVAEYGSGDRFEEYMHREMDRRPEKLDTEIRWMRDPDDYIRPGLMTFNLADPRWAQDGAEPSRPDGTCGCPSLRKSRFKLHRVPGTRITRAEAFVNGKRTLVRKGRDLREVTLGLPATGRLKVRIVATHTSGAKVVSTRTYDGCTKTRPVTRVVRPRS